MNPSSNVAFPQNSVIMISKSFRNIMARSTHFLTLLKLSINIPVSVFDIRAGALCRHKLLYGKLRDAWNRRPYGTIDGDNFSLAAGRLKIKSEKYVRHGKHQLMHCDSLSQAATRANLERPIGPCVMVGEILGASAIRQPSLWSVGIGVRKVCLVMMDAVDAGAYKHSTGNEGAVDDGAIFRSLAWE